MSKVSFPFSLRDLSGAKGIHNNSLANSFLTKTFRKQAILATCFVTIIGFLQLYGIICNVIPKDFPKLLFIVCNLILAPLMYYLLWLERKTCTSKAGWIRDVGILVLGIFGWVTYYEFLNRQLTSSESKNGLLLYGVISTRFGITLTNFFRNVGLKGISVVLSAIEIFLVLSDAQDEINGVTAGLLIVGYLFSYLSSMTKESDYLSLLTRMSRLLQEKHLQARINEEICEGLLILDRKGNILYGNKSICNIFSQKSLENANVHELLKANSWLFTAVHHREDHNKENAFQQQSIKKETCSEVSLSPKLNPGGKRDGVDELAEEKQDLNRVITEFELQMESLENDDHSPEIYDINKFTVYDSEFRDVTNEKKLHSFELTFKIILSGNVPFLLMIAKDTSQLAENLKLVHLDEYKNRLLSSLAHQLRTPLNTAIPLLIETLGTKYVPNDVKEKLIKPALCNSKLLSYLINDMLDYSRWNLKTLDFHFRKFSISEITDELNSLFHFQAKMKELQFNVNVGDKVPKVLCSEPQRLLQILINMISNAFKFTLQGSITINIDALPDGKVRFSVSDTGMGMKDKTLQMIFKLFGTEDYETINTLGVGLGMKVCQVLVHMLGSEGIKVTSSYKKGTTFTFSIPVEGKCDESADEGTFIDDDTKSGDILDQVEQMKKRLIGQPSLSITSDKLIITSKQISHSVLVVDDNDYNIYVLKKMLEDRGFIVHSANNGTQAVTLVDQILKNYEKTGTSSSFLRLIFMDIDMPIMNGYKATEKIKNMIQIYKVANIPIVFCSALDDYSTVQKCAKCGGDDFMSKPVGKSKLEHILAKYCPTQNQLLSA